MMFQLGSSLLDACVLSILSHEDAYGYHLTQQVKKIVDVSESTLYPVLRRLTKEGLLTTYDEQHEGRNRRYYQLTPLGMKQLETYRNGWKEFQNKVDMIMKGEVADD